MFQESLFFSGGSKKSTKTWITMPLSFIIHALIIGSLVVAPLMKASSDLPDMAVLSADITHVALVLPEPPPPPKGGDSTVPQVTNDKNPPLQKPVQSQQKTDSDIFIAPLEIPKKILDKGIDFKRLLEEEQGQESGVIGGTKDGKPDPIFFHQEIIPDNNSREIKPVKIQTPKLIHKVKPQYTKVMLQARIHGQVVLKAVTDIYGRVKKVEIISSAHYLLNQASIKAVKQWLYEPYIINGIPRPVKFIVKLHFELKSN